METKDFSDSKSVNVDCSFCGNEIECPEEMIEKSGQMGVPVIDVDGKIIVGFNERALRQALNIK